MVASAKAAAMATGIMMAKRSTLTRKESRIGVVSTTASTYGRTARTTSSPKITSQATEDVAATMIAAGITIDPDPEIEMTAVKVGEMATGIIAIEIVAEMIAERCQALSPGEMRVPWGPTRSVLTKLGTP